MFNISSIQVMYYKILITFYYYQICRRRPDKRINRIVALPGRNISKCNNCYSLRDALQVYIPAWCLQNCKTGPADHFAKFELHGSATRAGAEFTGCWDQIRTIAGCFGIQQFRLRNREWRWCIYRSLDSQ